MAAEKSIVLITGANAGIGFELAAQLLADKSKHVLLCSRSPEKGAKAVAELQARQQPGSVELLELDVNQPASITAAAKKVAADHAHLDALVNNAAIAGRFPDAVPVHEAMAQTFLTNVTGPKMMVEAFGPLLEKSTAPTARIINVSSGMGSVTERLNRESPVYTQRADVYRTSKAALNMLTACQSIEYGEKGIKVFAVCPGFTVSTLTPNNIVEYGAQPTSEGSKPIVSILNGERDAEHGAFLHANGQYQW